MNNIKVKVRLTAYTKGIIPNVSNFITDAPSDNNTYARKNNEWVDIQNELDQQLIVNEESGLKIETSLENSNQSIISIKQIITDTQPIEWENDTTYYIIEKNRPQLFINGGTAFSDEDNDYKKIIYGGNASTKSFEVGLTPLTSQGE